MTAQVSEEVWEGTAPPHPPSTAGPRVSMRESVTLHGSQAPTSSLSLISGAHKGKETPQHKIYAQLRAPSGGPSCCTGGLTRRKPVRREIRGVQGLC